MEKKKFKVLIIEDEYRDYEIAKKLLTGPCVTAYDSPTEEKYISMLTNTTPGAFVDSCKELLDFIETNKEDIRLIICDYRWNDKDDAGGLFIEQLRKEDDWFRKNIPVVVFTGLSNKLTEKDSFELTFNIVKKENIDRENENYDSKFEVSVKAGLSQMAENFDKLYQQHINDKPYKVAFSFTGSDYTKSYEEPHREFVRDVARIVMRQYGDKVFYDEYCIVSGWNPKDFKNVYENQCNFIVVFLSENYGTPDNKWTEMEWEGIKTHFNEDGVCEKNNVLFVPIGDDVNYENKLERLNVSPNLIWYKDGIKAREKYYSILKGASADIKEELMKCFTGESNFEVVLKCFMNEYNEFQKNGDLKGVASWIINHIENHDKSK